MSLSRRALISGRFRSRVPALRPPWALDEAAFEQRCSRCGECVTACPAGILGAGAGGLPVVDFSTGACTFCADCVHACEPGALFREAAATPWSVRAKVGEACLARAGVECRVCGESCEIGAIRFRPRLGGMPLPELDQTVCSGCGACVAPCPTQAISMETHQ